MPSPFDELVRPQPITALQIVVMVTVAALIAGLLTHFIRQSYNIRITVRGGHVDVAGTALAARRAAIRAFFAEWLPAVQNARLYGHWDGRRLSLYGSGLDRGQFQRLRNYLTTEL
jgi:S-adenosylmethionine:diacylglycerol 3-amino-3-carboxypropyl transferase